ncbi:sensor histidine kinase [Rugamonas rubra]|uniref:sensor histidine kinase n=1 Tax=Rugamonas rubra TaxID=758825 RepID=UPI0011135525|nr:ATP-binding protein [Rugamonas rubra]
MKSTIAPPRPPCPPTRLPGRRASARSAPRWCPWRALCCLCLLASALLGGGAAARDGAPADMLHVVAAEVQDVAGASFTPAPARVDSAGLPAAWRAVALPYARASDVLKQAGAAPAEGGPGAAVTTTWYRLTLPAFQPAPAALMLYAARVKAYGPIAVYVDGQLLHQRQLDGATWYWTPLWLALDAGQRAAPPREILFRLQHGRASHTALASVWLGSTEQIGWRYQGRQWLQVYLPVMCIGAFIAVGLFSAVVWFRRGVGRGYGLFALLAGAQFVRALGFYCETRLANDWFAWLMLNSLFWVMTLVHAFQVLTHGRRQRWLSRSLLGVNLLVGVFSLPLLASWPNTPLITPLIYLLAIATGATIAVAGARAAWRRSPEAMLMSAGVALCVLYGLNDWALQSNFLGPEDWYLGPYMNLQNFAMLCYLMYRRYIGALSQVEQSHARLALRLGEREAELADSYRRLREIEHKQTVAEERQRLMQDMHDGLGSSLHSALRAIERGQLDEISVSNILRACIDDLHLTIDSLEPVEADLLLLLATLRYRLGGRLRTAGIKLHWAVLDVPPLDWIDPRSALHILRILQEALTNIVKHTEASQISVATSCDGLGVLVTIADNGAGFELAAALRGGGKGLANQQRRAAAIGGTIRWEATGAGTRVLLWLPLAAAGAAPAVSAAAAAPAPSIF